MDDIDMIRDLSAVVPGPSEESRRAARAVLQERIAAPSQGRLFTGRLFPRVRVIAFFTVIVALMVTVAYATTSTLRVHSPNGSLTHNVVPYALPMAVTRYAPINPAAARPPVAYLGHPPPWIRSAGVWRSGAIRWQSNAHIDVQARSTARYRGSGHTVLVTLLEPSSTDLQSKIFELGTQSAHLANGRRAWTLTIPGQLDSDIQPPVRTVNGAEFPHGRFVVGVFSDLPVRTVLTLAAQVVVRAK